MDKLELRARARATARATGVFDLVSDVLSESGKTGRSSPRQRPVAPPPVDTIDEAQARAACRPMGELETVVQAADASGRTRTLYVVVPDLALKVHYQRLGFEIAPGCRVLIDAEAMVPLAVMQIATRSGAGTPQKTACSSGFNPYFDVRAA